MITGGGGTEISGGLILDMGKPGTEPCKEWLNGFAILALTCGSE